MSGRSWTRCGASPTVERCSTARSSLSYSGSREDPSDALAGLTVRERETLALMAEGRSNTAIAEGLVVTPGAVEKHITNIFSKLGLPACEDDHRRVLAVLAYLRVARPAAVGNGQTASGRS